MRILANIIWLIFGGLEVFVLYLLGSVLLCLTIIGIPFAIQTFKLAVLSLWPFGRQVVERPGGMGCLGLVMNVIWILVGGLWIALTHLLFALLLAITIIGLPWAVQHGKLAVLALTPFGKEIRDETVRAPDGGGVGQ